jgi:flavin reductase (DIM6/NTAB) family NADH-FMN oxidoreductase RutF
VHDADVCFSAPAGVDAAGVDPDRMRGALRNLVSPVTVITTVLDGRPWGLTVSAFTPVCLDPPTILVCVNRETATAACIAAAGRFGVNVLAEHQTALSRRCAEPGAPKFLMPDELLPTGDPAPGMPIIRDALVSFECAAERIDVGSHVVVLGRVLTMHRARSRPATPSRPLLYGNGQYHRAEVLDREARFTSPEVVNPESSHT